MQARGSSYGDGRVQTDRGIQSEKLFGHVAGDEPIACADEVHDADRDRSSAVVAVVDAGVGASGAELDDRVGRPKVSDGPSGILHRYCRS